MMKSNASLTSRIVGAIVVFSLAIIFIPVLLETNKIDAGSMDKSPIPDIPSEISTIVFQLNNDTGKFEVQGESPIAQFDALVSQEIKNSAKEVEMPDEPVAEPKSSPKPSLVQSPVKKAKPSRYSWMLQVASFKDHPKALKLREQLRALHYVTHIEERKSGSSSVWRVRIGPDFNKSNILKIQAELDRDMGFRGLIIRRR